MKRLRAVRRQAVGASSGADQMALS
jgi:hypothetical protein